MNLAEFVQASLMAPDTAELYRLLEETLDKVCGYDRVIFTLVSDHPRQGLKAGHGLMRNYPDDWMKHYIEKGYGHIDPVTRFGIRSTGPFLWDSLPMVMDLNVQQKRCMNESREAKFYNGAGICLRGPAGEIAGLGVASSTGIKIDNELQSQFKIGMLHAIGQIFYASFCNLAEKQCGACTVIEEVILTPKECEVLRLMAKVKKDEAIADEMHCTSHTINFHVRNIMKKLKVSSRTAAILKAINSGLVPNEQAVWLRMSAI